MITFLKKHNYVVLEPYPDQNRLDAVQHVTFSIDMEKPSELSTQPVDSIYSLRSGQTRRK